MVEFLARLMEPGLPSVPFPESKMLISLFPKITDNIPVLKELTWDKFATEFDPHVFSYQTKNSVPAFSPAEYPPGARRAKKKVKVVHFGVLDLDKLNDVQMELLREKLVGFEYIFYTTWSNAKRAPLWCTRLLLPFSRPVLVSEWDVFWPRFNHLFGNLGDPACKDPSRLYFIPAAPPGTEADAIFYHEKGVAIAVDKLLATPVPAGEGGEEVPRKEWEDLAKRLKRRQSPHSKRMSTCVTAILEGEVFAEEGERDEIIFQLTGLLVEEWPHANPKTLAAVFARSIARMEKAAPNCPSLEDVENKIRRHQEDVVNEQAETEQTKLESQGLAIRQAFSNGRSHPYTEDELNRFAGDANWTREILTQRWIIQKGKSFYFFFNGSYSHPYTDTEMQQAAIEKLAPTFSAGVHLWKMSQRGDPTLKSITELVNQYGRLASHVVVDLSAQLSVFDNKTQTLTEAPCPLRKDLKPIFDVEVDEWLRWLGGEENFDTLADWLACATRLDAPCAALYLDGVPGSGKTLLADGVARIWTKEKPTLLEDVMSNFNDSLIGCPLVLADETIPRDNRGRVRTDELRQLIQGRSRSLNRKFLPTAAMRGAIRLIITANNQELLTSNEALTANDIQAIVDRIIYIKCTQNAAKYLKTTDARSFVAGDRIATHALWLAENRPIKEGRRFLVEGSASSLHKALTTSSGLRSAVCNWLVAYLLSPNHIDSTGKLLVRREGGELLATSRGIAEGWKHYPTNEFAPSPGKISKAIGGLSFSQKKQLKDGAGIRTHYWVLDSSNLIDWAERNSYADADMILELLARPQEKRIPVNIN